ncbi:MAG: hypothetical protein AAF725_25050, partial [Acidobacteriota bacterium]
MSSYLLVDPLGDYAGYQKEFLDRLGLQAVALFSSPARLGGWQHKWRHRHGRFVVGEHLVDPGDLGGLAKTLRAEHPEGFFGIVPWDEMHTLLTARVSDALELEWNSARVMERFRDKFVMKQWLRQVGSPRINRSRRVEGAEDALAFQRQVGSWPIVIKPSGGAGAMSVFFATDDGELLAGCQRVLESGLGEVLLEEYIGGEEFAV